MYADDSVQSMMDEWWIEDDSSGYRRGRLIRGFLPHIDQIPRQLIATGRYCFSNRKLKTQKALLTYSRR
jgi:hypothetical protein